MVDFWFQGPNPFATPAPIDPLAAGGGGGIGSGTLIGFAGGAALALIPIVKSWVDNRNNMAAQTTQTTLATHTAMLASAIQRADRLEAQLAEVQKSFNDLSVRFARMEAQLIDKTHELELMTKDRDAWKARYEESEQRNGEPETTVTLLKSGGEFTSEAKQL